MMTGTRGCAATGREPPGDFVWPRRGVRAALRAELADSGLLSLRRPAATRVPTTAPLMSSVRAASAWPALVAGSSSVPSAACGHPDVHSEGRPGTSDPREQGTMIAERVDHA